MENELVGTKSNTSPEIYKSEYEKIDEFKNEIIQKGLSKLRAKQNAIFLKMIRGEISKEEFKNIEADFYKNSDILKKGFDRIDKSMDSKVAQEADNTKA